MRTTTEAKYDNIEKKLQRNVMIKNNASQYGLSSEQQRNSWLIILLIGSKAINSRQRKVAYKLEREVITDGLWIGRYYAFVYLEHQRFLCALTGQD